MKEKARKSSHSVTSRTVVVRKFVWIRVSVKLRFEMAPEERKIEKFLVKEIVGLRINRWLREFDLIMTRILLIHNSG